jgi:hypothetical protein
MSKKKATAEAVQPYAYGIGPNELSAETAKRMGLKAYHRITVAAGVDFDYKAALRVALDGAVLLKVGCEEHTLAQWGKVGTDLIRSQGYAASVNNDMGSEMDTIGSIDVELRGEYITVDLDNTLSNDALDAIREEALREYTEMGYGCDDDEPATAEDRLKATLAAILKDAAKLYPAKRKRGKGRKGGK